MIYVVVMSVCQGTDHAFYGFNVGMPGDYHAFYGCNVGIPGDKAMLSMVVMFNMPGPCFLLCCPGPDYNCRLHAAAGQTPFTTNPVLDISSGYKYRRYLNGCEIQFPILCAPYPLPLLLSDLRFLKKEHLVQFSPAGLATSGSSQENQVSH